MRFAPNDGELTVERTRTLPPPPFSLVDCDSSVVIVVSPNSQSQAHRDRQIVTPTVAQTCPWYPSRDPYPRPHWIPLMLEVCLSVVW